MKYIFLLLISTILYSQESIKCIKATEKATSIHWQYLDGNKTLTQSYNATAYMNKICKLNKES